MNKIKLTICILHYKKLPQLQETISRIEKFTKVSFKVKLLNQGYLDKEIKDYLENLRKKPNYEIIYEEKNLGCPPGRHRILQGVSSPFIATLDDDVYVERNWFTKISNFFDQHPEADAVGFVIYKPDGSLDLVGGRDLVIQGKTVREKIPRIDLQNTKEKFLQVDDLLGGVMVFKRELLNCFSWDPNFFFGFGDLDVGLQLKLNCKANCFVLLDNKVIHDKVSRDRTKTEYNKVRRDYHILRRSYLYFMKKWGYHYPFSRHIFYKYLCLLPNSIIRRFAYFRLNYLKL